MKRDMDLVRLLLLKVEEEGEPFLRKSPKIDGYTHDAVVEHVRLCVDAGLLDAKDASTYDGRNFIMLELTWIGHEFLDKVRDPEIWSQTKAGATKVGAWGIGLLGELATGYIKAKAAALGLPI